MAGPALSFVCGVDEAGRGPLAGPVFAAAVILDPAKPLAGLADSKTLRAKTRERLAALIRENARSWALGVASVEEIDALNILNATLLAMSRAVAGLREVPSRILVDGNTLPAGLPAPAQAIVRGDATVPAISAASILAKAERDAEMMRLHELYPQYAFDRHKGYGTELHLKMLVEYGPTVVHRRSFAPVRKAADAGTAHMPILPNAPAR